MDRVCKKTGCERRHYAKDLCQSHYVMFMRKTNDRVRETAKRANKKYYDKNKEIIIKKIWPRVKEKYHADPEFRARYLKYQRDYKERLKNESRG